MSVVDRWLHEGWLRPVDHALADALRRLRPDTDPAVLLAAALASRALAFGHGALPLAEVGTLCAEIDGERAPPPWPELESWLAALRASPWVAADGADGLNTPLVLEGDTLWLRRYFAFECAVATDLRHRAGITGSEPVNAKKRALTPFSERLQELFPALAGDPDDAQAAAARELASRRVLLLTGGPGTGKTTTVARALVFVVEAALRAGTPPPRIALAAPTGKAATRLAESLRDELAALTAAGTVTAQVAALLPTEARTLHRLLGWRPGAATADAATKLPVDLLVIDEASMIDLPMMARTLAVLPPTARLLLVGDPDQLPSVDTGDVLAALAASPLPQVRLTRVHRQRAEVAVGALAAHVRVGDADAAIAGLAAAAFAGVAWHAGDDRQLPAAVLAQALPAYRAVRAAPSPEEALRLARGFRVLTALRDGASGSQALNARIAEALQPAGATPARMFPGLLLMITANSPRHGLFNGDIGVVHAEPSGELRVWFEAADGVRAWLPSALPAHEPAFALTVHKAQGSEFGRVFLALPEHGARVLSRELLYTGLTRCRDGLVLWARDDVLRTAIARPALRWSGLAARLA